MALATSVNIDKAADNFQRRVNHYVKAMQYHSQVAQNTRKYRVSLGTPAVAGNTTYVNAQATDAAGTLTMTAEVDANFGRCVRFVMSGNGTPTITLKGRDYLGQPMVETITGNGTNAVSGVKAFKWFDSITWTAVASQTFNLGSLDKLGLPFRTNRIEGEYADGASQSVGTLVAGVRTDPQTGTTVDPRGTYDPTATLNGSTVIEVEGVADPFINASGNGGLYGVAHYFV